ncbi:hypothetical protein [Paracoccus sp. (in: a-proteobacteria)]|uniref:hypothetical protein n=1 Tax=Paracoccus sp. TaxID=267 RepID=UPI00289F0168|nr:hypothetical protein [Paracoccus sp. (in: a-proteobacteria)]
MIGTNKSAWNAAEIAFNKTQSQFLDRTRAMQDWDNEAIERTEKTRRLRTARLEREAAGKLFSTLPKKPY